MARENLALPGTSDLSERVFSDGVDLVTATRASLGVESIRAAMLVENWRKEGFLWKVEEK
ncbi:hypothetical protein HK097_010640, partial [Rhizophlyctis rosea]